MRKLREMQEENEQLKHQMRPSKRGKRYVAMQPETQKFMKESLKRHVWRKINFVSSVDQESKLAYEIVKSCDLSSFQGDTAKAESERRDFVAIYTDACVAMLNEHRNYVNTEIKKVCFRYMAANNGNMPNYDNIEEIVQREPSADKALFAWWWDEILPAVTGCKDMWSVKQRYYGTISRYLATTSDGKKIPIITPALEAYAAFIIDNNLAKWKACYKLGEQHPGKSIKCVHTGTENATSIDSKGNIIVYTAHMNNKKYRTKHTNPNSGQQRYGGFSRQSIQETYIPLKNENKKARKDRDSHRLETQVLEHLRQVNDITCETYELERKKLGKKEKSQETLEEIDGLFSDFEYDSGELHDESGEKNDDDQDGEGQNDGSADV